MLFYTSPQLNIYWDELPQCVRTEWHGFVMFDKLKDGLQKALELGEQKHAMYWVSDLTDLHVYTEEEQKWIINEFFPQLVKIGIKKLAIVKPWQVIAHMSLRTLIHALASMPLKVSFFGNVNDAHTWLIQRNVA